MHETLRTYRFWAFGEKTPSLLFMLREEYPYSVKILCFVSNRSPLILKLIKLYFFKTYFVPWHNFFETISEDQHCIPFLCHWCNMMYDVMLCEWCDDVMVCEWSFCRRYTHIPSVEHTISLPFIFRLHRLFFGVSALTFRCKFCIPLGTSFELLRLLFRRYPRWLFALRLIFRRYLALHSLWNDFWAENLHCAPLGMTFCSFGKLTLRSVEWLLVASKILVT